MFTLWEGQSAELCLLTLSFAFFSGNVDWRRAFTASSLGRNVANVSRQILLHAFEPLSWKQVVFIGIELPNCILHCSWANFHELWYGSVTFKYSLAQNLHRLAMEVCQEIASPVCAASAPQLIQLQACTVSRVNLCCNSSCCFYTIYCTAICDVSK